MKTYQKILQNLIIIFLFINIKLLAVPGDTLTIRTVEFGKSQYGWFNFPDGSESYQKIIMNYKIKCPCGEWDHFAYVFVRYWFAPNYRLNGISPAQSKFMMDTSWNYSAKKINSKIQVDSSAKKPIELIYFDISANSPTNPVKRMWVWPLYYKFTFDTNAVAVDSVLVPPDSTISLQKKKVDFNDSVTVAEDWEIFRYITPYGNGLSLGNGFNWPIDVTDFQTMLQGKIYINAPNGDDNVELTFDFIKGTPSAQIVNFRRIYQFRDNYNKDFEKNSLPPVPITLSDNEKMFKFKIIQSGHGWSNTDRCNEFCSHQSFLKVNGKQIYSRYIWRDDCGMNPVYPQGGTWLLNRSNWCPGAEVRYYDYNLTQFLHSGKTDTLDYDMEFYDQPITGDIPNYAITAYLISYSAPNFTNNVSLEDIITPSKKEFYQRQNPICGSPLISLKNNGKDTLKSLDIHYGVDGGVFSDFKWKGSLKFLDSIKVYLPPLDMSGVQKQNNVFKVTISNPNGKPDEYPSDNYAQSNFDAVPYYYNDVVIDLKTNKNASQQYRYTLCNSLGDTLLYRHNLEDTTEYRDTMNLADGCYEFRLINDLGYGLDSGFLRADLGSGYLLFNRINGQIIKNFNPDFGTEIFHQFRVGPKPTISVSTDSLNFGVVKLTDSTSKKLTIFPVNKAALSISDIKILGLSKAFRIVSTIPDINKGTINLNEGDSLIVNLIFAPIKAGFITTSLSVMSNDENEVQKTIKLTGTGFDPNNVSENPLDKSTPSIWTDKNPVKSTANIYFNTGSQLPQNCRITIFNAIGEEINVLFDGNSDPVYNKIELNPDIYFSGIYYIVLNSYCKSTVLPIIISK